MNIQDLGSVDKTSGVLKLNAQVMSLLSILSDRASLLSRRAAFRIRPGVVGSASWDKHWILLLTSQSR